MSSVDRPLAARPHQITLGYPDSRAQATNHEPVVGPSVRDTGRRIFGEAHSRRTDSVPSEPRTPTFAGFAVGGADDLDALKARLRATGSPFEDSVGGAGLFQPGVVTLGDPSTIARSSGSRDAPMPGRAIAPQSRSGTSC